MTLNVIFMGTPAFALPAFEALLASGHKVCAAYSQPPRPAGRGQKLTPSPIHQRAEAAGIPVETPVSLKPEDVQQHLRAYGADVALVAAYGLLLPQAVLDAPRLGCINIHPSALPRWRGAAPIQRTIMAGDRETACCIMQMEAGLDTGPVLLRESFAIPPDMDAGGLHDAMAHMGARLAMQVLDGLPMHAATQATEGVTYATKITKADQVIDWRQPAHVIAAQVRGLSPAPGATFGWGDETVKLYAAEVSEGSGAAGTVLDASGVVACGKGALRLLVLQRAGKQRVPAEEFLRAQPIAVGTVLS